MISSSWLRMKSYTMKPLRRMPYVVTRFRGQADYHVCVLETRSVIATILFQWVARILLIRICARCKKVTKN